VVLVTNSGEEILQAGDCAGFKAGDADGHHLQNRSGKEAVILEIGTRNPQGDGVDYPDIDLAIRSGSSGYIHKGGKPYPPQARK
ncbi:MAG: transcriptional regulator, partial [Gammaproteobacteria bacterium]|nr:transcriptional regulator [Gammaproteobacteria bacterium]